MRTEPQYRAAIDTPLGVEFFDFTSNGNGLLIVERFAERAAELRGYEPDECEVVTIEDLRTHKLIWPKGEQREQLEVIRERTS